MTNFSLLIGAKLGVVIFAAALTLHLGILTALEQRLKELTETWKKILDSLHVNSINIYSARVFETKN